MLSPYNGRRKLLEVMDVLIAWIVVMILWMYAYLQTRQVVYIKYVPLFQCDPYLNKEVYKNVREQELFHDIQTDYWQACAAAFIPTDG